MIGKRKRVLAVLTYALDVDRIAGAKLVAQLLGSVRGVGGFRGPRTTTSGTRSSRTRALRSAIRASSSTQWQPPPALTREPVGAELSEALRLYVRRARVGHSDAALVTGTGKDFLEAAARHALVEKTGSYDERMNFPMTLYHAFYAEGLAASVASSRCGAGSRAPLRRPAPAPSPTGAGRGRARGAREAPLARQPRASVSVSTVAATNDRPGPRRGGRGRPTSRPSAASSRRSAPPR
jgi:hypothetical protein